MTELPPTSHSKVQQLHRKHLAAEQLGDLPGPRLVEERAKVAGDPLQTGQFGATLSQAKMIEPPANRVELREATRPDSLPETIVRRVRLLGEPTFDLLCAASVLGSTFGRDELASMMGLPAAEVGVALSAAVAAQILDVLGGSYAFRHDLLRDALYQGLPSAVRRGLHSEAAEVLSCAQRPLDEIVPHLVEGATADDPRSIELLVSSGCSVRTTSPAVAVTLLERALALLTGCDPRRDQVVAALVSPLSRLDRPAEAVTLARQVHDRPHDPSLGPSLRRGLVEALVIQGRTVEMCEELESELALDDLSSDERNELAGRLAQARILIGDFKGAGALGREVLDQARWRSDDHLAGAALTTLVWVALAEGHVHDGVAAAEEAATLADSADDDLAVDLCRGTILANVDRLDEARSALHAGRRQDAANGYLPTVSGYHWALAELAYLAGRWDEAAAEAEAGLALVGEGVGAGIGSSMARVVLARIALHRGDVHSARAQVERAMAVASPRSPDPYLDLVLWVWALVQEAEGDPSPARQALEAVWDESKKVRGFRSWRTWVPELVRLNLANGARARAGSITEEVEALALEATGVASAQAAAMRCRGLVETDHSRLIRASELFLASCRPVEAALTLEEAGWASEGADHCGQAIDLYRRAGATYADHGAIRDLDRVTAALRRLGVRNASRILQVRPVSGWEGLTRTEARVAELVASGLTNRQIADLLFVSPRTVGSHVQHIFAKLAISSRLDLVVAHRGVTGVSS